MPMPTFERVAPAVSPHGERLPVVPEDYPDRDPQLRPDERAALETLVGARDAKLDPGLTYLRAAAASIARLEQPVLDIGRLRHRMAGDFSAQTCLARSVLRRAMLASNLPFWGWSEAEWRTVLYARSSAYRAAQGTYCGRATLVDMAYLLGGITDPRVLGCAHEIYPMARVMFGDATLADATERVSAALAALGYCDAPPSLQGLRWTVSLFFLLNRSPRLEDVTGEFVHAQLCVATPARAVLIRRVLVALQRLGIVGPAPPPRRTADNAFDGDGVAPLWLDWCVAWYRQDTRLARTTRRNVASAVLMAGRWLLAHRPAVTAPEQWTEDLALEYVAAMCTETKGAYTSARGRGMIAGRADGGTPLGPKGIDHRLYGLRVYFGALQDRPHAVGGQPARKIALNFKPSHAFATPRPIKRLIQPDPRDIDLALWYKLVYAAATLAEEDLPKGTHYPLALYRAVALLWVSAGRRSNEIARLRVGCVRREWDLGMIDDDGRPVEEEAGAPAPLCYLQVPSNKYRGPFWIWIPAYVADAIDAWLAVRPVGQPPLWDEKDRAPVEYLFCYRATRLATLFINQSLIPTLFRKAMGGHSGAPRDARGAITSHRARSQRATMLRTFGVSLDDIAEYLGHTDSRTVAHYARTNPIQLARRIQKASEEERIIEGVMDLQAAADGRNPNRWFLGYDADGDPQYCGHPAWHTCPHRLECVKCSAFIGGETARLLAAGVGVTPIRATLPMTAVEHAAVDGNVALFDELLAAVKDSPPPPPHPDALFNPVAMTTEAVMRMRETTGQLGHELIGLSRRLAEARRAPKGKGVAIRALKGEIDAVMERMVLAQADEGPTPCVHADFVSDGRNLAEDGQFPNGGVRAGL